MIATRAAYGNALLELGELDPNVVVLDADLSKSTTTNKFASKFPDRFFNMGIAEANMMGVAAGLAASGKMVFVSTFAIFATGRPWEQIRNTICYCNLDVKIAASHAGLAVGPDGSSHQMNEDIAIMSAIPNMIVVEPCDGIETKNMVFAISKIKGPMYMRLGRDPVPTITIAGSEFKIGKGLVIRRGKDVSIIACGMMVAEAIEAADILLGMGVEASVINMHTIKPLDKELILNAAQETHCLVTAEQHVLNGGLGSAVASFISKRYPVPIEMVGIDDRFGQSGDPKTLFETYELTSQNIVNAVKRVIKRAKGMV